MDSTAVFSITPALAILVSLLAALLIPATGERRANLREAWSVGAGVIQAVLVASMLPAVLAGQRPGFTLVRLFDGVEIAFRVDSFGLLFGLGAAVLWIAASFYSIGYMRTTAEHAQTRYYACFALALTATMGVAFSANLFTLFLFYEALTIITYPLVAHKETDEARAGARKYAIYLLGAAKLLLLPAVILTYTLAGTLDFRPGGIFTPEIVSSQSSLLFAIFLLMLWGLAKNAVMPLHSWLPAAMVAPTPVSALLHAVAVVKTGVFATLRVFLFIFGADTMSAIGADSVALVAASATILYASFMAVAQDNLKARLAYSTISQLSYIVLGGALLTASGIVGGIAHITNHAVSKITLFFCAGSIYASAHKTEVSQLSGIAKKMPWTMAAFAIGTLSLIGIPPMSGFISKWNLAVGTMERGNVWLLVVLLTSSLMNAAYLGPIVYKAYFEEPEEPEYHGGDPALAHAHDDAHADDDAHGHGDHDIREVRWMTIPLTVTAALSLLAGVFPDLILRLARMVLP
jgi:multicomponent Na+:H+ antiporter subunit D